MSAVATDDALTHLRMFNQPVFQRSACPSGTRGPALAPLNVTGPGVLCVGGSAAQPLNGRTPMTNLWLNTWRSSYSTVLVRNVWISAARFRISSPAVCTVVVSKCHSSDGGWSWMPHVRWT